MKPLRHSPADAALEVDASADLTWRLMQWSARLLLEYNEPSAHIKRQLARLSSHHGVSASTIVEYRGVTLVASDGRVFRAEAHEFRINVAVSVATQRALDDLCLGRTGPAEAMRRLESVESTSARHQRWLVIMMFGLAAASLALLLQADSTAVAASGMSAAVGLIARQELARRSVMFPIPTFVAGLVGALLGGLVIRVAPTTTPNLCLIVPALMLVPGAHLINSIDDIVENEMQPGIGRLCFAATILFSAALGVVVGAWLTVNQVVEAGAGGPPLTLLESVALAGAASCGFATFFNSPWRIAWISIVCGMLGHGIRALSLQWGAGLALATLLACLGIGIAAGAASFRLRLPFASIAFASAVPMMPGVLMYQSIAAAMRLSAAGSSGDATLAVAMLSSSLQASFVVAAMAIGLATGVRIAAFLHPSRNPSR